MAHPLRDRGTPRGLAESRQVIDFEGDLSDFPRLSEIVEADLGRLPAADRPAHWRRATVRVRLEFGFADVREALPAVTGAAAVTLDAVCQRCLEALALPLDVTLRYVLQPPAGQADAQDYGDYEVWELAEETLAPLDLVEEALIMALPLSAAHATAGECGPLADRVGDAREPGGETVRPFAGLKAQLDGDE